MAGRIPAHSVECFYRASLVGLRYLDESGEGRKRFGAEADAQWRNFAGHLTPADRMDLALRNAAVSGGVAFAPAAVFHTPGLASDEPFGPDWPSLDGDQARQLWQQAETTPVAGGVDGLEKAAASWGAPLSQSQSSIRTISPATRLAVPGAQAVADTAAAFAGRTDLSWREQVTVVAAKPQVRHLAGIAGVMVGSQGPTRVLHPHDVGQRTATEALGEIGVSGIDQVVVSDDADEESRGFLERARDEMGLTS